MKDSKDVKERIENDLLEEYDKFIIEKGREERQIVTKAEVALKVAEKELSKLFQHKYFSSEYTGIHLKILVWGLGEGEVNLKMLVHTVFLEKKANQATLDQSRCISIEGPNL